MTMRKMLLALVALLLSWPALAQSPNTDTYFYTPNGGGVNGAIGMCLNTSNKAVPCSAANVVPSPVSVTPFPTNPATQVAATPISGNATGSTGAVVGTLAGAAAKTTYICGFNVQAIGGTAAVGPITVAGLNGSSQVYQGSSTAAGGTVASGSFNPCIPASAVNTAITITTTADGTATAVDVNSWGYQL
jgi:hypothetical protein